MEYSHKVPQTGHVCGRASTGLWSKPKEPRVNLEHLNSEIDRLSLAAIHLAFHENTIATVCGTNRNVNCTLTL